MGRGSGEGYWWGHRVRGIVEERGESIGGEGLTGGEKPSHLTSLLYPSMGPRVSRVMKSKLQNRIATNKPLLFAPGQTK